MASPTPATAQTVRQNHAIRELLAQGYQREEILETMGLYNGAIGHPLSNLYAPIATIPAEALNEMIQKIESDHHASTNEVVRLSSPLTTHRQDNQVEQEDYALSESHAAAPTRASGSTKKLTLGKRCPGDGCKWDCSEKPAGGRKGWHYLRPFDKHFRAKHILTYRNETGAFATCSFCRPPLRFNGDGSLLIKHLWNEHMDPTLLPPGDVVLDQEQRPATPRI